MRLASETGVCVACCMWYIGNALTNWHIVRTNKNTFFEIHCSRMGPQTDCICFNFSLILSLVCAAEVCYFLIRITYNDTREGEIEWITFPSFLQWNSSAFQKTKKILLRLNINWCLCGLLGWMLTDVCLDY